MSNNNDYIAIAMNDYKYVTYARPAKLFNNDVSGCQQVVEKLLKGICLHCKNISKSDLHTHNLRTLYNKVSDVIVVDSDVVNFLSTLTDYYIDARYPGDDYVDISEEEANKAYEVATAFVKAAEQLFTSYDFVIMRIMKSVNCDLTLNTVKSKLPTARLDEDALRTAIKCMMEE